jgi:hypothetical protein
MDIYKPAEYWCYKYFMFYKSLSFEQESAITKKLQDLYQSALQPEFSDFIRPYSEISSAVPELAKQFDQLGLNIRHCYLFRTAPYDHLPVHQDLDREHGPNLVLNWPLFNCEQTPMSFYHVHQPGTIDLYPKYQQRHQLFDEAYCELLESFKLLHPCLVDVHTPHAVLNSRPTYRVIMSFRFHEVPMHLWN